MAYATLASRQFVAPESDSVEITTSGGAAFSASNWFQLAASISADSILTGITIRPTFVVFFPSGPTPALQIEIGVGAVGVEAKIAAWPVQWNFAFNAVYADNGLFLPLTIGIDAIPSGARLVARIKTGSTDVQTYRVAASYLKKPLIGSILTTDQPQVVIPDSAAPIAITPGGSYSTGAAATIRSASGPALVLTGLSIWADVASIGDIELDLYADGDLVHQAKGGYNGKQGLPFYMPLRRPLDAFPLDCLIEGRARIDYATPSAVSVYLAAIEKPL